MQQQPAPLLHHVGEFVQQGVGEADRVSPDPSEWKVTPPDAPRGSLVVRFTDPVDAAVSRRTVVVVGPDGGPVEGRVALSEQERVWTFSPSADWTAGAYELVVDPAFEDLAGNRPGRLFEETDSDPAGEEAVRVVSSFEISEATQDGH